MCLQKHPMASKLTRQAPSLAFGCRYYVLGFNDDLHGTSQKIFKVLERTIQHPHVHLWSVSRSSSTTPKRVTFPRSSSELTTMYALQPSCLFQPHILLCLEMKHVCASVRVTPDVCGKQQGLTQCFEGRRVAKPKQKLKVGVVSSADLW